jgi:hypothetical protein
MSQQQPPGYGPHSGGYGPPPGYPPQGYGAPGQPYPAPEKPIPWYHGSVFLAVALLFCWPIGLVALWTSAKTSLATKLVATAIFGGLGVLFLIGSLASKAGSSSSSSYVPPTPVVTTPSLQRAAETPAAAAVTESCAALSQQFGPSSKLSDLQKDELWKNYAGKRFSWQLKITEVSSGVLGGYTVQAKCSPKSPSLIQDIMISYDGDAKSFVLGLQKDETYTLSGVLGRSSTLLGLSAEGTPR